MTTTFEDKPAATTTAAVEDDDADLEIPELPADFFENGVVGKYYEDYRRTHMVCLDPDVAEHFGGNSEAVNDALRTLIGLRRILNPEGKEKGREDAA